MKIECVKSTKSVWMYLEEASLLLGILALVLYAVYGVSASSFVTSYSSAVFWGAGIGIALGIVCLVKTYREVIFVQYLAWLFACISFVTAIIELFGGIIYGEESAVMPASFIVIFAALFIAFILSLAAGIMKKD